ncbi:MAG: hypothetical protein GF365_04930 [Candidatus Buchananbacteria bacterium]|nr:hypothetical protein [Candidatus Buchananbacteria bacterium]
MPNKNKTTKTTAKVPKRKIVKKTKVFKKTTVKKPKTQKKTQKQSRPQKTVKKKTTNPRQTVKTKKKNSPKKRVKKQTVAKKKSVVKKAPAKKSKPQAEKKRTSRKTKPKKAVAKPLGKRIAVKQIEEQEEIKPNLVATLAVEVNKSIDDPFSDFSFGDELPDNQNLVNDLPANEPETVPGSEPIEYIEPVKNGLLSEKQKLIITYTAIASMMIVLVGFWFVGIRNSLSQSLADTGLTEEDGIDKNQTEKVQEALGDFNQQLNLIGESMGETEKTIVDSLEKNKDQILKEQVKNNIIDQMKEQLETQPQAESNLDLEQ